MADNSGSNGNHGVVLNIEAEANQNPPPPASDVCFSVPFMQKLVAEVLGTYFLIFAGCASVVVNVNNDKVVSLPGISIVWGLAVMVLVYSMGHISGAHFNPAVTIAFATCKRFPLKQVPAYIIAQAFVIEFIITFYLMFIISGVATDSRAIGEFAGISVGATVLLNVLFAGSITGASMNPARTLGPAIVWNQYKGIWVYLTAPIIGAVSGAWAYNMVRYTDKPL
ncbi:NOD26-like intrinsic protein 1;2, NOD26-LIKE INTRINSIC PROTEIN 2 [Hibiscus trionum]|uniref:NOD26-like intrinsic protein 12, NOD26-LIKE INTRINSIC PROTEIN 2 n=1 Tax=Hibiscus trionum TaxID=183268 RepID=A0A9W7M1M0_HIBTR|nr:NOD26-like intrinsic protein 1;2, NOD26-LIKE INTRINSIC PROTEIN 2 [Hibiscus trionum]